MIEDYEGPVSRRFLPNGGREDFDDFVARNTSTVFTKRGYDRLGTKLIYYPIYNQVAYSSPSRNKFYIVGVFRIGNTAMCLASEGKSRTNVINDLFWLINKRMEFDCHDSYPYYARLVEDLFKNNTNEFAGLIRQSLKSVGVIPDSNFIGPMPT